MLKWSLKIVKKKITFTCMYFYHGLVLTMLTYTEIEHAQKSTCLFNAGFCQPMCIPSLMLKEYCIVA